MIHTERVIKERGYDVISVPIIDDARLGRLAKAMVRLAKTEQEEWDQRNPRPSIINWMTDWGPEDDERIKHGDRAYDFRMANNSNLFRVVEFAAGGTVGLYSDVLAIFKQEDPKLVVGYYGYNDDPDPDWRSIHSLYAFDGFMETEEGREIAHLAVHGALSEGLTSGPPHYTAGIPTGFFTPFLKPQPKA